jgi:lipoprotein-releasing system permease protein
VLPLFLGILALGVLALLASVGLVLAFRFERFVGLRYLSHGRRTSAARIGLLAAGAATAVGLGLMLAGRGQARGLETAGVIIALNAGLVLVFFALLSVFSVFTTVATMGVVMGVASLVVVLAVTSGFEREFQDKVLAVNAHLLVMGYGEPSLEQREQEADEYMRKLRDLPGLRSMSKFSLSAGEVMIGKVGANLKGVDITNGAEELRRALVADPVTGKASRVEALAEPAHCAPPGAAASAPADGEWIGRIILGTELARRLHAKIGECISVLVPFSGDDANAQPVSYHLEVVGLFRMGFYEYDTRLAYVSLADARRLGGARPTLFGVELRFHDPQRARNVEPEVVQRLGPNEPHIVDWETLNHNLFMALQMQKLSIGIFLAIIIIVAAFNIFASLTMIVLSKVREIAILSAMGARGGSLLRMFFASGSLVGFVGNGIGIGFGLAVCGLARLYGYPLDPKVYIIGSLPVEISAAELLFVAGSTQVICLLATIYPAWRAARLRVVEGLRHV